MADNNPNIPEITPEEEAKLAKMAARRTGFKKHLAIFILLNAFLWVVWSFLFRDSEDKTFLMAILFVLIVWLLVLAEAKQKAHGIADQGRAKLKAEMAPKDEAGQEAQPEEMEAEEEEPEHRNPNYID